MNRFFAHIRAQFKRVLVNKIKEQLLNERYKRISTKLHNNFFFFMFLMVKKEKVTDSMHFDTYTCTHTHKHNRTFNQAMTQLQLRCVQFHFDLEKDMSNHNFFYVLPICLFFCMN